MTKTPDAYPAPRSLPRPEEPPYRCRAATAPSDLTARDKSVAVGVASIGGRDTGSRAHHHCCRGAECYLRQMEASTLIEASARALGHPVSIVLAEDGHDLVACSLGGDPLRMRAAWLDPAGQRVIAKVGCPPLRPSRARPVVACSVGRFEPEIPPDRLLLCLVAPGVTAVRAILALENQPGDIAVSNSGLAVARLPLDAVLIAVDALDQTGEPVGRLVGAGVADLRLESGKVGGRIGTSHGMAAGFGAGVWVDDLDAAAFDAGFTPVLPTWLPDGLTVGKPHIEPDVSYPAAPPAVVIAWHGEGDTRVLLRQAPAPLAMPDVAAPPAREVDVNGAPGVLRGRWLPTLVWETPGRAFGLQMRRVENGEALALRIARSIPNVPE